MRFIIIIMKGEHEFNSVSNLSATLPTAPSLDWEDALQHCGLIKGNIQFIKEKVRSVIHNLPFEQVLIIMIVQMVLHIVKFVNGFP